MLALQTHVHEINKDLVGNLLDLNCFLLPVFVGIQSAELIYKSRIVFSWEWLAANLVA
jgi:hypothetical protein